MKIRLLILLIFAVNFVTKAQGITITSATSWTVSPLSSANIITKAGKDYAGFETSPANQTLLKLTGTVLCSINIQQVTGANWDSNLKIYARRSGAGTGLAILLGGGSYQLVTTSSTQLFTAALGILLGKEDIPIQYQIQGLSVLLPAKSYSTTIMYTISVVL
ncbi:hypothetical protein [Dyadobacter frigoris]|uniref:DUF4402 domain-containing protein n=1 Tax=Dyadobacter frigoris TaxID=2576211 RepID=A0A4U6D160_9BACT|nr:hypothetical protein [Dyadobacter frigoris]TKT90950.1 hypothetical protein FDK13_18490 [Dyadobacter frigoris]GLU56137.1 hypothetical protein Dfri01_55980 [Dyadobacter frigoris]